MAGNGVGAAVTTLGELSNRDLEPRAACNTCYYNTNSTSWNDLCPMGKKLEHQYLKCKV